MGASTDAKHHHSKHPLPSSRKAASSPAAKNHAADHPAVSSNNQPASPQQSPDPSLLFEQLANWKHTPAVLQFFAHHCLKPIPSSRSELQAQLHHAFANSLLNWSNTPHTPGTEHRECNALFRLYHEINPLYITPEQLKNALKPLEARWHKTAEQTLIKLLSLNSQNFPSSFPASCLTPQDTQRWLDCFPPEWKLQSLSILQNAGLFPTTSPASTRILSRFFHGQLHSPQPIITPLSTAQNILQQKLTSLPQQIQQLLQHPQHSLAAIQFLLACFGGEFQTLKINGPCQHNPLCHHCSLQHSCLWFNSKPPTHDHPLALLSAAKEQYLSLPQLLQILLKLSPEQTHLLSKNLPTNQLKYLANLSPVELETWCKTLQLSPNHIRALLEICRRFETQSIPLGATIQTAWDIFKHFQARIGHLKQEQFFVVMLDKKRHFIGEQLITQGTLDGSLVHPREVFNPAIRHNAHSIIAVHNHPSGDPQPSKADLAVTQGLIDAGETLGIPIQDHIIISEKRYVSLMEMGYVK